MEKIVHNLRKQPEHVRVKILYIATLASAFLLFVAWSFVTGTTVSSKNTQTAIEENLKPFSMLESSIINSTKNFSWPSSKKSTDNADTTSTTIDTTENNTTDTTDSNDTVINPNQ